MNDIVKKEQSNIVAISQGAQYQKLMEIALTTDAGIEKLEKIMMLQENWEAKEAKKTFIIALSSFQAECPTIKKSKPVEYNGKVMYKYAPIEDVITQVGALIASNGLSYRFEQDQSNGIIGITCIVSHIDGHSESNRMESQPDNSGKKNPIQSIGSTVTYLKKYTFLGSFGIATADEDLDGRMAKVQGDFLSDEQIATIEDLLGSVDANRGKFLAFFKTDSVLDLPLSKYNQAVSMLKSKAAK